MTAARVRRLAIDLDSDLDGSAVTMSRESSNGWTIELDGRVLGVVYRVEAVPSESQWRARPRGRGPASVAGHPTRGAAIAALYEATK